MNVAVNECTRKQDELENKYDWLGETTFNTNEDN